VIDTDTGRELESQRGAEVAYPFVILRYQVRIVDIVVEQMYRCYISMHVCRFGLCV
jgi:hypothetical protein